MKDGKEEHINGGLIDIDENSNTSYSYSYGNFGFSRGKLSRKLKGKPGNCNNSFINPFQNRT